MTVTAVREALRDAEPLESDGPGPVPGAVLHVLPEPQRAARRAPFAVFLALLLGGGLAGLLLLNTQLQQGSFELASLQGQQTVLSDRAQVLGQQADSLGAPQVLQSAAAALGMIPAADPRFLSLTSAAAPTALPVTAAPQPPTAAEIAHEQAVARGRKAALARQAAHAKARAAARARAAAAAAAAKARAQASPSPAPGSAPSPAPTPVPTPQPSPTGVAR